jgi:hypothetical protein
MKRGNKVSIKLKEEEYDFVENEKMKKMVKK